MPSVDQAQTALIVAGVGLGGSLVGSFFGSFFGPWLLKRLETESIRRAAIRTELAEIVCALVASHAKDGVRREEADIAFLRATAQLELLLKKSELPIVSLITSLDDLSDEHGGRRLAELTGALGAWMRGDATAAGALASFREGVAKYERK